MEEIRAPAYRRNVKLETLLSELNELLWPVEQQLLSEVRKPKYPVVLIIGTPRGGSTLFMQWLAQSGYFAYPTNLMSRFYGAPAVGAKIQKLLTDPDYNFRNEILDFNSEISYKSDLGKTQGALEPNEFWYFWRRFLPNQELRYLTEEETSSVQVGQLIAELAAIEAVFDKPLALKGLMLELNLPFFSSIIDHVLFIYVQRHPFYNIQSLLEARVKFYGNVEEWYSIKPREYESLNTLSPIEQVVGQVYYTQRAVETGLHLINPIRQLTIDYEYFCESPEECFNQVMSKLSEQGFHFDWHYPGPDKFQHTNQIRLYDKDVQEILKAYRRFSGKELSL